MNNNLSKGFGHILLLLGLLISIGVAAGVYYLNVFKNPKFSAQNTAIAADTKPQESTPAASPTDLPQEKKESPEPIILRKTYINTDFGYSFVYPAVLSVQTDSEEEYSKRNNGDARANFSGYVKYPPEKVLSAVSVLGKDLSFDNSAFTIWIFYNTNQLAAEAWFERYWYYPFLWGVFDRVSKEHITLDGEATISGRIAKYKTVSYQQGSPKYFYLSKGDKMFLFRLLEGSGETADHILETFKFTD